MKTITTSFNYIDCLSLTIKDAKACTHAGECLYDVQTVMAKPYVKKQLDALNPDTLVKELKEYGAWDADELSNHNDNLERIVWLAAGDIADGN